MLAINYKQKPAQAPVPKLRVGMTLAFTPASSTSLAGIPATVIYIWPRFHSGEYLVTLEFARPVRYRCTWITQIDAFVSELEPVRSTQQ